ncbi:cupin domain-containing protein [Streptomyces sp. NPDC019443]|uniref:cupin domain-containing protein n=1 Tax=Streptomyces sp. NPDC019443 TaxID=3365061 RepID=UPI0037B9DC33
MQIRHSKETPQDIVREPGAKQVRLRRLIDTTDGADRFVLTEFAMAENGASPPHYHDWEHELYIIEGTMGVVIPGEDRTETVVAGDVVFIPRDEPHGFVTGPTETCRFLVVAPTERPPVRNFFLSEEPYEFSASADAAGGGHQ